MRICRAGTDTRTSACHPAGTLFLQHIKQLNSAAGLWFTSFSPLYILAKSCLLAKISAAAAAASKATPGWCRPMAASGTPLHLSPSALWLSTGAVEPRARLCLQSLVARGTAGSAGREAVTPEGGGNKATKAPPPVPTAATRPPQPPVDLAGALRESGGSPLPSQRGCVVGQLGRTLPKRHLGKTQLSF